MSHSIFGMTNIHYC